MPDNPLVIVVYLALGGLVGLWAFFRFPLPTVIVNYPTMIVSHAVKFIPALAVLLGGQTTLQTEPVKRPDEHLSSQAQSPEELDETRAFQAATAFVSLAPLQGYSFATARVRLADNGWAQFVASSRPPPPPPLPSVASNGGGSDDRKNPQQYEKS
jgi:hypothetical protein